MHLLFFLSSDKFFLNFVYWIPVLFVPFQDEKDSRKSSIPGNEVEVQEAEEGFREESTYTKQPLPSVCRRSGTWRKPRSLRCSCCMHKFHNFPSFATSVRGYPAGRERADHNLLLKTDVWVGAQTFRWGVIRGSWFMKKLTDSHRYHCSSQLWFVFPLVLGFFFLVS